MLTVSYFLSEKARRDLLISSGVLPSIEQSFFFDLSSVSTEVREKIVRFPGTEIVGTALKLTISSYVNAWLDNNSTLHGVESRLPAMITEISQVLCLINQMEYEMKVFVSSRLTENSKKLLQAIKDRVFLPSIFSVNDSLLSHLCLEAESRSYNELVSVYSPIQEELKAERVAKEAAQAAATLLEETEAKIKADATAKAQSEWVAEFGSERLKLMAAGKFQGMTNLYEFERAAVDFPQAIVDLCNSAQFRFSSSPSLYALQELKKFSDSHPDFPADLVVLSKFPSAVLSDDEEDEEDEEDEVNIPDVDHQDPLSESWEAIRFYSSFTHALFLILPRSL